MFPTRPQINPRAKSATGGELLSNRTQIDVEVEFTPCSISIEGVMHEQLTVVAFPTLLPAPPTVRFTGFFLPMVHGLSTRHQTSNVIALIYTNGGTESKERTQSSPLGTRHAPVATVPKFGRTPPVLAPY